jgi:hypothetical protein
MQHAVDAEAHVARIAPGLEMNIAGALLERVSEQPVADVDDVLVVGVELAASAELDQLLEIGDFAVGAFVLLAGSFDRFREVEKLDDVVLYVDRVRRSRA